MYTQYGIVYQLSYFLLLFLNIRKYIDTIWQKQKNNVAFSSSDNKEWKAEQQSIMETNDNKRNASRSVHRIVNSIETFEGEGFLVHRAFPSKYIEDFDPFLLLDEFGPMVLSPGEAKGAPDHPHRGFETVTYMLSGQFEHKDSQGNKGKLNSGDVQWMTAGAGVVHSEMPGREFANKGGKIHGLQLWVNLPKHDKMVKPRYQDITASKIPKIVSSDGKVQVKVIAGNVMRTCCYWYKNPD